MKWFNRKWSIHLLHKDKRKGNGNGNEKGYSTQNVKRELIQNGNHVNAFIFLKNIWTLCRITDPALNQFTGRLEMVTRQMFTEQLTRTFLILVIYLNGASLQMSHQIH